MRCTFTGFAVARRTASITTGPKLMRGQQTRRLAFDSLSDQASSRVSSPAGISLQPVAF